jgi:hypothetical protein
MFAILAQLLGMFAATLLYCILDSIVDKLGDEVIETTFFVLTFIWSAMAIDQIHHEVIRLLAISVLLAVIPSDIAKSMFWVSLYMLGEAGRSIMSILYVSYKA